MQNIITNKIRDIKTHHKIILYFSLGALWSFSQIGYSLAILPWFTFIPYLFNIKHEDNKYGFIYSWIFGFSVYLFHLWWMPMPIASALSTGFLPSSLGFLGWIIAWILNLVVCAYHGLFYALVFLIAKYISNKKNIIFYLAFPIVTVVLDYFFPKLWHDQIGYSQYVFFHFSQVADIFGVPFISLLIMSCNSTIIIIIESYLYKKSMNLGMILFINIIFFVAISGVYGFFRNNEIIKISNEAPNAKIGVVQGNFTGLDKLDKNKFAQIIITYNRMSENLLKKRPDLIVWPETAIPKVFEANAQNFHSIKNFYQVPLLSGIHLFDVDEKKREGRIYNSLVLISDNKKKLDHYHKRKLLPFAEKVPIPFLNSILNFAGYEDFSPGNEYKIMETGNIKISPNICYEAIIPSFVRKSLNINKIEANIIINVTNDSWYGNTIEPKMHYRMAGFRAIENRKTLVRSTCTGNSVYFTPSGAVIYESPLFKQDSIVKKVPLLEIKTIYRKWGWLFIWILAIFLLIIIIFATYRKYKYKYIKYLLVTKKIHKKNLHRLWRE